MNTYDPIRKCIYCGETTLPPDVARFSDEHIIPLALGGNLVLPEASCKKCERIINKEVETPIAHQEWGYFRTLHNLPRRHKKKAKTHIKLRRKDGRSLKVPVKDYSAPVFLYQFSEARALSGEPRIDDNLHWSAKILGNHDAEEAMRKKYPDWDGQHALKTRPNQFARMLAKIGYGYAVAELGFGTFDPLVLDIILGESDDLFRFVGGTWEMEDGIPDGNHITEIHMQIVRPHHAFVIVDVRLFSSIATPRYHVVAGMIDFQNSKHVSALERHRLDGKIKEVPFSSR